MAEAVHLRAADRTAVRWKNGGGWTWEVLAFPPGAGWDTFDWRVSIAEIDRAGPFSLMPGLRRGLAVITGDLTVRLRDPTEIVGLSAGCAAFWFDGARPVKGEPQKRGTTALNVMVRPSNRRASIRHPAEGATSGPVSTLLISHQAQAARVGDAAYRLDAFDALWLPEGGSWQVGAPAHAHSVELIVTT